jgi:hypothetical protein
MSARKKTNKTGEIWALGQSFGLVSDGGWVDTLQSRLQDLGPDVLNRWSELLTLARDAKPRVGGDWVEVQIHSEGQCGYPGWPHDPPHPDPGTEIYQETLMRCAPDDAWLERVRALARAIGEGEFAATMAAVYNAAMLSGAGWLNRKTPNREILRALIWFVVCAPASEMVEALGQLAIWSVEHRTAQAATICLALAATAVERSSAVLRMGEMVAKRPTPRTRFERCARHVERKLGITPEDSAERFAPAFGLDKAGCARTQFGDCGAAELRIEGSRASLRYFNASGKAVAAVPAAVRNDYADELEEARAAGKGLQQLLTAQRRRIEAGFIALRTWDYGTWRERYLEHPVLAVFARRLIWTLNEIPVIFADNSPRDIKGHVVSNGAKSRVSLWHPLPRPPEEVAAWRSRLETLGVTQPFKQAHREIYVLTDAERSTGTYSNRFAAHILRQSQFRALAIANQWEAPFLGAWDAGDSDAASRKLPDDWQIEFWLDGAGTEHGNSGGYLHVSTDQVRFYRGTEQNPAPLNDVPPLIFSEAMRDVDLFVGVASVGNDPTWHDGGPQGRHRDYWHRFAFGDLSASAQTRREVLERLIPKLRIAGACSLLDRFLVVRGSLRTYKIHLGSGNILMEPNDQYLCIVPDRRAGPNASDEQVFLPFEGDTMLSLILSKAFLLTDDSKIQDQSILHQIK